MVTIKTIGMSDVKLTEREAAMLYQALVLQVRWQTGGMFGDGENITDKVGYAMAKRVIKKLGY